MSDVNHSGLAPYSVENDLQGIFKAVMDRYDKMKFKVDLYSKSEQQLIDECRDTMKQMSTIYRESLSIQTTRMDFTDRTAQWSYMYLYMLRHVHLVHSALTKALQEELLQVKPENDPLDVCMIGGGPGSDILGICLLMNESQCQIPWTNQVFCLDVCDKWEFSWREIHQTLPEKFRKGVPKVEYSSFNYQENNLSTENQERIKEAKVVTMIKSLSSAAAWLKNQEHRETSSNPEMSGKNGLSVYNIMNHMQPGAILLFIDTKTRSGRPREVLMGAAKDLEMEVLLDADLPEVRMPTSFLACNRKFSEKIDYQPCSSAGCNEMILLRKPGDRLYGVKLEVTVPNSSLSEKRLSSQSAITNKTVRDFSYNSVNKRYADYFTPFWENKADGSQTPLPSKLKKT